jgi:hypothetical protein
MLSSLIRLLLPVHRYTLLHVLLSYLLIRIDSFLVGRVLVLEYLLLLAAALLSDLELVVHSQIGREQDLIVLLLIQVQVQPLELVLLLLYFVLLLIHLDLWICVTLGRLQEILALSVTILGWRILKLYRFLLLIHVYVQVL